MTDNRCKPYNRKGYIIRVSEDALIHMCLSGLEAYVVRHRTEDGSLNKVETWGLAWGTEITLSNGQTLYDVRMVTADTSAGRGRDWCEPNLKALEVKRDVMTSFWPQHEFLGGFHTHPYNHDYLTVPKQRLYRFSPEDRELFEDNDYWRDHGTRIGLVLTIAYLDKKGSREPQWITEGANSPIEFTLGNYRMWLKGYVMFLEDGRLKVTEDNDDRVVIDCPSLVGLVDEYAPFGRAVVKRGKLKHEAGAV